MSCSTCESGRCGDCEWLRSEDFKNCQHEHLIRILNHDDLYRCEHCGRVLTLEMVIEMTKGEGA